MRRQILLHINAAVRVRLHGERQGSQFDVVRGITMLIMVVVMGLKAKVHMGLVNVLVDARDMAALFTHTHHGRIYGELLKERSFLGFCWQL